jgi:hypothetical protein
LQYLQRRSSRAQNRQAHPACSNSRHSGRDVDDRDPIETILDFRQTRREANNDAARLADAMLAKTKV